MQGLAKKISLRVREILTLVKKSGILAAVTCIGSSAVEQETLNLLAVGSIPTRCTTKRPLSRGRFVIAEPRFSWYLLIIMENMNTAPVQPSDRDLRKAEQAKRDRAEARKAKLMPMLRLGGIVLAIVVTLGVLVWIGEKQDGGVTQPSPISGEITNVDHTKGSETAQITLIEYADFQCPTCAAYTPVLEQLLATYPEDIRVVYRYFPLQTIHPNATIAAQAAEAAAKQGKFWEMHEKLFDTQADWNRLANPRDTFTDYAEELGLDTEQFKNDMDSKEVKNRVQADYRSGVAAGVSGTPTFYLNGEFLENPRGFDAFKDVIEAKLQ